MTYKNSLRELTYIKVLFVCVAVVIFATTNKSVNYTWSDAEGYYMYLPALSIYGFSEIPLRTPGQFTKSEKTGRYYDKYTAGVAIMQLPFYGLAYVYASINPSFQPDGYSQPFQRSILLAALFYVFVGMFILYRFLRREFSPGTSLVVLISIFFGTNLFYYTHREPGMAHVYAFFLWTLLIVFTDRIYERPKWSSFILLSLVISLLVFVRPSNAIGVVFILFWNTTNLLNRLNFILRNVAKYAILIVPFIVLSVVQLFLWRHMNGEPVFYSYNAEPGFIYFTNPKIGNVLFHVHNGLFIYAPILVLSVTGLIIGIFRRHRNFILIAIILAISTYVFASWWAWWFGGAYGHRCYVDLLPALSLPMAYLSGLVFKNNYLIIKVVYIIVCAILIFYSIQMTIAYRSPWDGPNFGWSEFWKIFNTVVI